MLAKIGYKSKNHTATLCAIDEFFVKKKIIDKKLYLILKDVSLKKEEIEKISNARDKREIVQYSITKNTTHLIAEQIKKDAYDFVNKVELIINR